jgi:membrane-associated phospholipid phosphatase
MHRRPQRILLAILVASLLVDCVWGALQRFDVAVAAYALLGAYSVGLVAGSWAYQRLRPEDRLAAMLFGAGFLCAFSAIFSVLNYFLLTVAGGSVDALFARADLALGFDWRVVMALVADHPRANLVLRVAYDAVLPQIAVLVVCLGCFGRWEKIYPFCLAIALGAAVTIGFWTLFPSFGAFAVYDLPAEVAARINVALDGAYARELKMLLATGPGHIAPDQVKGLIGFPSFHAVLAVLAAWYARSLRFLYWPILVLTALMLLATPIEGGHHLVDVLGGIALAMASAWLADRILPMRLETPATKAIRPGASGPVPAPDGNLALAAGIDG